MSKKLIIIDAYNFVFRAFHALPPLHNKDGLELGAVYGFINMLIRIKSKLHSSHWVLALDSGGKNFRHNLYSDYKANRPPAPESLIKQFPIITEAADAMSIHSIACKNYEADDIIASLVKQAKSMEMPVTIISSDKDLMQLVEDGYVSMLDPIKLSDITESEVATKFGVKPTSIRDFLALVGDSSDNIPGVPSIGPKTAAELINSYHSLEGIYDHIEEITQNKRKEILIENRDKAFLSRQLVDLCYNVPIEVNFDNLKEQEFDKDKLGNFLLKYNFKTIYSRLFQDNSADHSDSTPQATLDKKAFINWLDQHKNNEFLAIAVTTSSQEDAPLLKNTNEYIITISDIKGNLVQCTSDLSVVEHIINFTENHNIKIISLNTKNLMHLVQHNIQYFDDLSLMSYLLDGSSLSSLTDIKNSYDIVKYYKQVQQDLISEKISSIYEQLDKPLVGILYDMEHRGILINSDYLSKLSSEFKIILQELENNIYKLANKTFNVSSPKQLGEALFEHMSLPIIKKNKTGAYDTSASVLEELSMQGHTIADHILEWRQIAKLDSTYTHALINQINPQTGRIHTNFSMTSTSTGRLSSSNPNLQNIPIRTTEGIKIRKAFIAQSGYQLISADFSQIELRVLAHMADVEHLKEAFSNNLDIHKLTASQIFDIKYEEVDDTHRRKAKAINFGIIYGQSAFGLAKQLGISRQDAAQYIDLYFKRYPGIKEYMQNQIEFARKHGFVRTLYNRKIFTPMINNKNFMQKQIAERSAINAPIQGTAADIMKKSMIAAYKALAKHKNSYIILQIHDELICEVIEENVADISNILKHTMENAITLSIPFTVNVDNGKNWAEI